MPELNGSEIGRKRGDTAPDTLRVNRAGGIAGFGYIMTINRERRPVDDTEQVVQIVGQVTSDADGGDVEFPWDATDADQEPGKYWYDVEQTDGSGKVLTVLKNVYRFYQDITKN